MNITIGKYNWTLESTTPDWRGNFASPYWQCVLHNAKGERGGVTCYLNPDGNVTISSGWGRLSAADKTQIINALYPAMGWEIGKEN